MKISIGSKIDKVTILGYDKKNLKYKCQCECGNIVYKTWYYLEKQGAKSGCGCFRKTDGSKHIGERYGRLMIISTAQWKNKQWYYNCICDCGEKVIVGIKSMMDKNTVSCGCYNREVLKKIATKHGKRHTRLYGIWKTMKSRCYNEKFPKYQKYGARGIKICEDWKNDFKKFYEWANQNGYSENLSIDRIDVNGDYEPKNCRWVNAKIQANNKTTNRYVQYKGEVKSIAEWASILNMNCATLRGRLNAGWSVEKAFVTPVRPCGRES